MLGYTCANDVSARDWQLRRGGGQWCRGKTFDTFAPLGPRLVTADEVGDPGALRIATLLNGERVQDWTTGDMIFGVPELIEFLSGSTTLLPGTVILTGTPHGVGFPQPADRVARGARARRSGPDPAGTARARGGSRLAPRSRMARVARGSLPPLARRAPRSGEVSWSTGRDRERVMDRVRGALAALPERTPLPDISEATLRPRVPPGDVDPVATFAAEIERAGGRAFSGRARTGRANRPDRRCLVERRRERVLRSFRRSASWPASPARRFSIDAADVSAHNLARRLLRFALGRPPCGTGPFVLVRVNLDSRALRSSLPARASLWRPA
ncbi:fumarylacetoacetate hydrolase family protein [Sorangium cellulosum So ce56]|uniref:Fumarylacetoacetate hydrolase family protein n=1 Tax=Sorangium cellulosum (strain So ce56) TaxID=448385 RepID=A9FBK4_SORC5|nr:fumarylacetoacetate hydrolase family protein [Sorangium cellulosum So ce56]